MRNRLPAGSLIDALFKCKAIYTRGSGRFTPEETPYFIDVPFRRYTGGPARILLPKRCQDYKVHKL